MAKKFEQMAKKEAKSTSRLTKLFNKSGELSKHAQGAIQISPKRGNRIYPIYYSGSGRYIKSVDNTYYIKRFLELAGMKYKSGNDAPRGGKVGQYLQVSPSAMALLKSV